MTIDALSYVGVSRFGYARTAEDTLRAMDDEDVATALVAPMHPVDGDLAVANRVLANIVRGSGGRLVGLVRVDPWDRDEALAQLTGEVEDGARGVYLDPAEEHYRINDPVVRPIAERAAELRIPVVVATGFPWFAETPQVARFVRWCGDNAVVMTNGGQLSISGMGQFDAGRALASPNVHVLSNGMYRNDYLERTVREFGADRLLFAGVAPRFDLGYERRRVRQMALSDEQRALVLAGNATRLFGLG
ncbi:MAG TPA: amidohydrolase family protein [Pseudonocardiaceae bacterium]|jgi:hypothetical protein|nr:amidohydrolase family protein [Pseudonocardiaceae bacterium]